MRKNRRRFHPNLDALEERLVLSTYGNPWPNPSNISISFTPDGTTDGFQQSSLDQLLDSLNVSGNDWQLTMLRAFQTWATEANINFTLRSDNGAAFGVTGSIQGDSRFGDIRVGAIAQSSSTYALTQPFSYGSGTWAGDVNLNATASFGINNPNSVDLFTVALHEAGHSLGLDVTTTDTSSVMYQFYTGPHPSLSASDIAAVQAIYGVGTDTPNKSFATASTINPGAVVGFSAVSQPVTVQARLNTPTSTDFFVLNQSTNPGPTHVQLKTAGLSLLDATLTVYDANHKVLGTSTATDPRNGNLSIALPGLTARSNYYVSVKGANGDAFSVGAYQLRVTPDSTSWTPNVTTIVRPDTSGYINGDDNNLTASTPIPLLNWSSQYGTHNYFYPASLTLLGQARYYSFTSPASVPSGSQNVMTVLVWGVDPVPVDSMTTIYDAKWNPVAATVISHENGSYVVQVPKAAINSTYYVKVSAYNPTNPSLIGNFDLSINFASTVEGQNVFNSGKFPTSNFNGDGNSNNAINSSLTLGHDSLYNFVLLTSEVKNTQFATVVMTITDANGNVVSTLQTKPNQAQSLQIWLKAGTYKVSVALMTSMGTTVSGLNWSLSGEDLSSPIRVYGSSGGGSSPPRY